MTRVVAALPSAQIDRLVRSIRTILAFAAQRDVSTAHVQDGLQAVPDTVRADVVSRAMHGLVREVEGPTS